MSPDFRSGLVVGVLLSGAATLLVLAAVWVCMELAAWWERR